MSVALRQPREVAASAGASAPRAGAPAFWQAREERWWMRLALLPLALLAVVFGLAVTLRRAWYGRRAQRVDARVISVGNVTVGGAGKTPVTLALARRLQQAGRRPVILSRGYGRREKAPVVASDGARVLADAAQAGDEPVLLARGLPGVPVLVGADRVALAREAVRRFSPCTLLLDDGMQHLRLHRDRDVVVVDASDPFGNGRLLPRGPLREPVSALARAALVWLSKVDQADPAAVDRLAARVRALTGREPVRSGYRVVAVDGLDGRAHGAGALAGRRVLAVAGIARPESFAATLRLAGAEVVGVRAFGDHHAFEAAEIEAVRADAARLGAEFVAVTEKDAVRLPAACGEPFRAVRVDVDILAGGRELDAFIEAA